MPTDFENVGEVLSAPALQTKCGARLKSSGLMTCKKGKVERSSNPPGSGNVDYGWKNHILQISDNRVEMIKC